MDIRGGFFSFLRWSWTYLDTLVALGIAVAVSVGSLVGWLAVEDVVAWILATLALVAFAQIRDRMTRLAVLESIENIESAANADALFTYASNDVEVLELARSSLDLIQETGNLIYEQGKRPIVDLLKKGGSVRAVLTAPTAELASLMALRNWDLDPSGFTSRWRGRDAQLRSILSDASGFTERLEIRYLPYPIGVTAVIADARPQPVSGHGLIRDAGFRVTFVDKPDLRFDARSSPIIFNRVLHQFEHAFNSSSKLVLLSGDPRSGKTTTVRAVLRTVDSADDNLYWVVSEAVVDDEDNRTGFQVETSDLEPRVFARRQHQTYETDTSIWDEVAEAIYDAIEANRVIVVDEIGPLQLRSHAFRKVLDTLRSEPNIHCIASIATHRSLARLDEEERTIVKAEIDRTVDAPKSTVVRLDRSQDRSATQALLENELSGSLRTLSYLRWGDRE